MKKQFIILLIAVIGTATMQAQDVSYNNSISINMGITNPLGDFAAQKLDDKSGFAKTGFSYNISYARKINPYIAAKFEYAMAINGVNTQPMADILVQQTSLPNWNVSSDAWYQNNLMLGLEFTYPQQKLDINFRIMSGLMFSANPSQTFSSYGEDYDFVVVAGSSSNIAFVTDFGFGFDFKINEAWAIGLNCDYIFATNSYDYTTEYYFTDYTQYEYPTTVSYSSSIWEQNISTINITLGIKKQF